MPGHSTKNLSQLWKRKTDVTHTSRAASFAGSQELTDARAKQLCTNIATWRWLSFRRKNDHICILFHISDRKASTRCFTTGNPRIRGPLFIYFFSNVRTDLFFFPRMFQWFECLQNRLSESALLLSSLGDFRNFGRKGVIEYIQCATRDMIDCLAFYFFSIFVQDEESCWPFDQQS